MPQPHAVDNANTSPVATGERTPAAHVGTMLRDWRVARRMSQLDLALEANVSSRHLSFVETGRSHPSRAMVSRLADVLQVPLRARNSMLVAAGYAAGHNETSLAAPALGHIRRAVEFILRQHEPYPAYVVTRHWDVLAMNEASRLLFDFLTDGRPRPSNMLRSVFDPDRLRPLIANWEEVAGNLVRDLHNQVATAPDDHRASTLLESVLSFPGVPARWRNREPVAPMPILTTVYRKEGRELRFFSTITIFATPQDVTLEELRIECAFPADEATVAFCREQAVPGSPALATTAIRSADAGG